MPLREIMTPNHLTRFVNLTPTLATPLQKENVLVMSKKELVRDFAMSRANIKGKSSLTAKVSVAVRDTNKVINTLQNHYGMAICQNNHNLYAMRKAVAAVLQHSIKNYDMDKRHHYCLRTAYSWCKYQSDKIT